MNLPFIQLIIFVIAGMAAIVLLTVRFRIHPFFALLIACFITGLGTSMQVEEILRLIKAGFGDIMSRLALIIVLGTTIGVLLEKNGSTTVMADFILRLVGQKRASLALSITGFIVGLPIFCDSGYIVLNGINKSLAKKAGLAIVTTSVSLASGLYAVHCLLPPHPGATAAASTFEINFGQLLLYGLPIAIPAMLVGHWWSVFAGRAKKNLSPEPAIAITVAFLPVFVPVLLMSIGSFVEFGEDGEGVWIKILDVLGDPAISLTIGVVLAILSGKNDRHSLSEQLGSSVEKAGGILVIIGAGGAFGAVLAATHIGDHFSDSVNMKAMGVWFPFLLTCVIKTAQGSSTVAIVTASSIVLPMLTALGLDSENGRICTVLAMGAGSMMISHTNDAYFWVISKFSDIDIRTMLRVHSVASILMGLITILVVYLLSIAIL